jgi:hypothetical protein
LHLGDDGVGGRAHYAKCVLDPLRAQRFNDRQTGFHPCHGFTFFKKLFGPDTGVLGKFRVFYGIRRAAD